MNHFNTEYEINMPSYSQNFSTCEFSRELVNKLRENGFIVRVIKNTSFLGDMINTAIAYGYDKKIGFSSYNNDFMGYSNGCDNILFDFYGQFNKWSRCAEISKTTPIDEIINILKEENESSD